MLPKQSYIPTAKSQRHSSVHDQIAAQAIATPDAIAVVSGDNHLTYKQLQRAGEPVGLRSSAQEELDRKFWWVFASKDRLRWLWRYWGY